MKISRLREVVVALCFVLLLALVAAKIERDASTSLAGAFRAVDGDSLVLGEARLRLKGIDAPELEQTCTKAAKPWNCGLEAKLALAALVAGRKIECTGSQRDKYDRLLVICRAGSLNINRDMVVKGLAVSFGDYELEEGEARAAQRGLWGSEFVVPAEWRSRQRSEGKREEPHFSSFFRGLFVVE